MMLPAVKHWLNRIDSIYLGEKNSARPQGLVHAAALIKSSLVHSLERRLIKEQIEAKNKILRSTIALESFRNSHATVSHKTREELSMLDIRVYCGSIHNRSFDRQDWRRNRKKNIRACYCSIDARCNNIPHEKSDIERARMDGPGSSAEKTRRQEEEEEEEKKLLS